jgi:hypothetical protein
MLWTLTISEPDADDCRAATLKEAQRGFLVPMRGEQEVNGLTLSVDSPIQVLPLTFDLDIGFAIRQPLPTGRFLPFRKVASRCGVNFWTQR